MHYHLIGIKGSGMSALACILKRLGANVTGSDVTNVYFTDEKLNLAGIKPLAFDKNNINADIDTIIVGNAFGEDNAEYQQALNLNIPLVRYYDFVQELVSHYYSIGICGTNGKTTTTGMVTSIINPEELVALIGDGTGLAGSNAKTFVFEACEYKNTFHHYHPNVAVVTNIEMDHPDFFKDIKQMIESYQQFVNQAELLVYNADDANASSLHHNNRFGFGIDNKEADVNLIDLVTDDQGATFKLVINNNTYGPYTLPLFGMHMVYNALCAISVSYKIGIDIDTIINNLSHFNGVSRRFNVHELNKDKGIYLIDDYAHHPTSIALTLNGIRQKYPDYTVSCLFQAHTYSRVNMFHEEFAKSLSIADNVYIDDIYGSIREQSPQVSKQVMIDDLKALGAHVIEDIVELKEVANNHIIALLGAGDIDIYMIPKIKELINNME